MEGFGHIRQKQAPPLRWFIVALGLLLVASVSVGAAVAHRVLVSGTAQAATVDAAEAAPASSPSRFTLTMTGDILVHSDVYKGAAQHALGSGHGRYDFAPMLAPVKPAISRADLALCHLESPLVGPGEPITGYPTFGSPPELANDLAQLGFDGCSTASNHSIDKGLTGVRTTLAALDAAGLGHVGSARSAAEATTVRTYRIGTANGSGPVVAHLAYTYGLNGLTRPADQPWLVNLIDAGAILRDARAARAAGAKVVIVSLHWGQEFQSQASPQQMSLARTLLESADVDLIVGHHVHVVQPLQQINGKWVLYGLGNLMSSPSHDFAQGASREGYIPTVTFQESSPGSGHYRVTHIRAQTTFSTGYPIRAVPIASELTTTGLPAADAARLRTAQSRTRTTLLSLTGPTSTVTVE